jgi:hypothetical protein
LITVVRHSYFQFLPSVTMTRNWTESDEITLVEKVYEMREPLFGKFKGSKRGESAKVDNWQLVADFMNA